MKLAFGAWEPDSDGIDIKDQVGRTIMSDASGVYPSKVGYGPINSLAAVSSFALPATCIGVFSARTSAGGYVFFAGTATKLYKYDTGTGWVDYTRTAGGDYSVPTGDYWSFTQFGSQVIACNINDAPQVIDIDTGATAFTALGGSPPASRYVTVVGDFVILACQSTEPTRLVNSAINDATGWTVGTNLCDQQDFADGGRITGLAGGEFGWVVQEHAIRRMIFQPGFDQAFRFERVEREHGVAAGYSLVSVADTIYFYSDDGFYSYRDGLVPIGAQRVNQWFRDNSDALRFFSVLGFTDPYGPRVYWAFFHTGASTYLDRVLIYDWQLNQFSYMTQSAAFWGKQVTAGTTLEALDVYGTLEAVPYPLDSRVWEGGQPVIAAVTTDGKLAFLNGTAPLDATLLTSPLHVAGPQATQERAFVQGMEPIGEYNDATVRMRVGKREKFSDAVTYTASISPSARAGIFRCRSSGRLHSFETTITQASGTIWHHAEGLDIEAVPDGKQ